MAEPRSSKPKTTVRLLSTRSIGSASFVQRQVPQAASLHTSVRVRQDAPCRISSMGRIEHSYRSGRSSNLRSGSADVVQWQNASSVRKRREFDSRLRLQSRRVSLRGRAYGLYPCDGVSSAPLGSSVQRLRPAARTSARLADNVSSSLTVSIRCFIAVRMGIHAGLISQP
jgi:hypothetical protein